MKQDHIDETISAKTIKPGYPPNAAHSQSMKGDDILGNASADKIHVPFDPRDNSSKLRNTTNSGTNYLRLQPENSNNTTLSYDLQGWQTQPRNGANPVSNVGSFTSSNHQYLPPTSAHNMVSQTQGQLQYV